MRPRPSSACRRRLRGRALAGTSLALLFTCGACARADHSRPTSEEAPPLAPSGTRIATPTASAAPSAPAALSPDAAPPTVPSLTLQQRAEACLEDPSCPASEANRHFRAPHDAHENAVDCLRFADGDGTQKDAARARACLERSLAGTKCDGSSAGLWQAELATYLIDAVGGPADLRRARALFDGCFDDVTRQAVLEHAAAREANPASPRLDFCKDSGGTTLTSNECSARARQHEATRGALQAKSAAAGLDDEGRRMFAAASSAYASYASAMGSYVYEVFKDGSIRNGAALAAESDLLARRTASIAKLPSFTPRATSPAEVERSSRNVDVALKKRTASAGTPELKATITEAQAAWTAYRDAEIALYVHAFGAKGPDVVHDALLVRLNGERVLDLGR